MGDISAIASTAAAVGNYKLRENVTVNILRMDAQAEQAMAAIVTQNARQIQALSQNPSNSRIDIFV